MLVSSAEVWTASRNLKLGSARETLIYAVGRVARGETLPAEVWLYLLSLHVLWEIPDTIEC